MHQHPNVMSLLWFKKQQKRKEKLDGLKCSSGSNIESQGPFNNVISIK